MSKNNRSVYRRPNGDWVNKKDGNERATSLHETQKEAENTARDLLKYQGGGELTTHGKDGIIRSKDTISPGNDPYPPKDTEN
jgi:hypothetical protein